MRRGSALRIEIHLVNDDMLHKNEMNIDSRKNGVDTLTVISSKAVP